MNGISVSIFFKSTHISLCLKEWIYEAVFFVCFFVFFNPGCLLQHVSFISKMTLEVCDSFSQDPGSEFQKL